MIRESSFQSPVLLRSTEEVQLCEGGGETAGEKRKEAASATGAQREEGPGEDGVPTGRA